MSVLLLSGSLAAPASIGAAGRPAGAAAHGTTPAAAGGAAASLAMSPRRGGSVRRIGRVDARAAARTAIAPVRTPSIQLPAEARLATGGAPGVGRTLPRVHVGRPAARLSAAAVDPVVLSNVAGMDYGSDQFTAGIANPSVAAGGGWVVESVTGLIRVFTRSGATVLSLPAQSLFALDPGMVVFDTRVIWDAAHGRWVGIASADTFTVGFPTMATLGTVTLAVSETADPTGAWDVDRFVYTADDGVTPHAVGIARVASASDKIVITAEEMLPDLSTSVGSGLLLLRWSDILAGVAPRTDYWFTPLAAVTGAVPADNHGSSSEVHVVAALTDGSYDLAYLRIATFATQYIWITYTGTVVPFCTVLNPRQPGPPDRVAVGAYMGPASVAWQAGVLAVSSTCDAGGNDGVRVTLFDTTVATPTPVDDEVLVGDPAQDVYGAGLAFTPNGTLFSTHTISSAVEYPSMWLAARQDGFWDLGTKIADGMAKVANSGWAQAAGGSPDPLGADTVWLANQFTDAEGYWATRVVRVTVDGTAPTVGTPVQELVAGSVLRPGSLPVRVRWTASDAGSGVVNTTVLVGRPGPSFNGLATSATTSVVVRQADVLNTQPAIAPYQYLVVAIDGGRNQSAAATSAVRRAVVYQATGVTYAGRWSNATSTSYLSGSTKYSATAGASVTFTTSAASFGFVTTRGSTRGKAKVYVDGKLKTTINLKAATTTYRTLAYVLNAGSVGRHTIKVVVVSGRIDADGFVVLK